MSVEIKEMTSDDFFVNPDYADALASGNLLQMTGNSLQVGDKGAVLLLIEACGCTDTTIENSASTSATPPTGVPIEDISTDGPDPDPDTSGNPDEEIPTMTDLSTVPVIGLAKRSSKVWLQDDGCTLVEYEFNLENLGNVDLADVTLSDTQLAGAFGASCQSVEIKNLTSDDFLVNADYADALATGNLLQLTGSIYLLETKVQYY